MRSNTGIYCKKVLLDFLNYMHIPYCFVVCVVCGKMMKGREKVKPNIGT